MDSLGLGSLARCWPSNALDQLWGLLRVVSRCPRMDQEWTKAKIVTTPLAKTWQSQPADPLSGANHPDEEPTRAERRRLRRQWAQLIRRVYEADPLLSECGAQMRILSFITDPSVVRRILKHLRRTRRDPSRAPPSATDAPVALAS